MNETLFYALIAINILAWIVIVVIATIATDKYYIKKQSIKKHIVAMITIGLILYFTAVCVALVLCKQTFTFGIS